MLDLGVGTGAAAWPAAGVFTELRSITVLDQVESALGMGRKLARTATNPAVRSINWQKWQVASRAALPPADLVMISYVLGELPLEDQQDLVTRAAVAARGVVVVEPGTPAGCRRVTAARTARPAHVGR